jgi:hypothetical protein
VYQPVHSLMARTKKSFLDAGGKKTDLKKKNASPTLMLAALQNVAVVNSPVESSPLLSHNQPRNKPRKITDKEYDDALGDSSSEVGPNNEKQESIIRKKKRSE